MKTKSCLTSDDEKYLKRVRRLIRIEKKQSSSKLNGKRMEAAQAREELRQLENTYFLPRIREISAQYSIEIPQMNAEARAGEILEIFNRMIQIAARTARSKPSKSDDVDVAA